MTRNKNGSTTPLSWVMTNHVLRVRGRLQVVVGFGFWPSAGFVCARLEFPQAGPMPRGSKYLFEVLGLVQGELSNPQIPEIRENIRYGGSLYGDPYAWIGGSMLEEIRHFPGDGLDGRFGIGNPGSCTRFSSARLPFLFWLGGFPYHRLQKKVDTEYILTSQIWRTKCRGQMGTPANLQNPTAGGATPPRFAWRKASRGGSLDHQGA